MTNHCFRGSLTRRSKRLLDPRGTVGGLVWEVKVSRFEAALELFYDS
jgi:hypothetical protein